MSDMKTILIVIVLCLSGCAMFKNTSKTNAKETQQSSKEAEFREFVLKSGIKETQVYSYWNDSGFYQYQRIMEQVDQSASRQLKTGEEEVIKKELSTKKTEPSKYWIWMVVIVCGISILAFTLWHN
jgi:hypothetical protein